MHFLFITAFLSLSLLAATTPPVSAELAPTLQQGKTYLGGIDIEEYWVSEKLDGIRARWTGSHFLTRNGNPLTPPAFFTEGFPRLPLDGELWKGRGEFQTVASTVLDKAPNAAQWREIKFMVFDHPSHKGTFTERLISMKALEKNTHSPYFHVIPQFRLANEALLMQKLKEIEHAGGEGLMLQHGENPYTKGRTHALLKVKSYQDAEATVTGYTPGKGKYLGHVGALKVVTSTGITFKLGSGLSDLQRKTPPPVGSLVTYKYYGLTNAGKPRFASFLNVRALP